MIQYICFNSKHLDVNTGIKYDNLQFKLIIDKGYAVYKITINKSDNINKT